MPVRGIRGATTVAADEKELVLEATRELLQQVLERNEITEYSEIVSAVFTTSPDVISCFPAEAARSIGMSEVPLLCAAEIAVPGALQKCIRILLHVNTEKTQKEMTHVYLRNAQKLRPDMTSAQ